MKLLTFILVVCSFFVYGADSLIKLEEVGIVESDNSFILQTPYGIKLKSDKGMFILDKDQIIHLGVNGKYKHNYFKKGQGPGEFMNVENIGVNNKCLMVHQAVPNKIVCFGFDGKLIKELKPAITTSKFLCCHKNRYFFLTYGYDGKAIPKGKYRVVNNEMLVMDSNYKIVKSGLSFPSRWFSKSFGNFVMANMESDFLNTKVDDTFVCSYEDKYKLDFVNLDSMKLVKTVRKEWEPIKVVKEKKSGEKKVVVMGSANKKYYRPIQKLLSHKDKLMVITSEYSEGKGVKTDVYNKDGEFLGASWLPVIDKAEDMNSLEQMVLIVYGDYLYKESENSDGEVVIKKYRITYKL